MAEWYPSCLARLIVRLDEGSDAALASAIQAPAVPTSGTPAAAEARPAAVALPSLGEQYAMVVGVVPMRATIRRMGLRDADAATVAIDANYLPLDPRMVRACAIDLYMGAVRRDQYGEGMERGDTRLSSVVPSAETWRFVGWCDQGSWSLHDGTLMLEARGLQSLLQDMRTSPALLEDLDAGRSLAHVAADLIASSPMTRGMRLVVRGVASLADVPLLSESLPRQFQRRKSGAWRLPAEDTAESYWDALTRLCLTVGWVPSVELATVVLQPARTQWRGLVEAEQPQLDITGAPMAPLRAFRRRLASGETLQARRMVYGANVATLEWSRPWAEARRAVVEVRADVPGKAETLSARYPILPSPARLGTRGHQKSTATEDVDVLVVSGVSTQAQLQDVARQVWHERAMRDVRGTLTTHDMASYGAAEDADDLLDVRPGDTMEVRVAASREAGGAVELLASLGSPELVATLEGRNIDPATARQWADALRSSSLPSHFRVAGVEHQFDAQAGYACSLELTSYLHASIDEAAA